MAAATHFDHAEHTAVWEAALRLGGALGCELIVQELSSNTPRDAYVNALQWCAVRSNYTLYEDVVGKLASCVDVHAEGALEQLHKLLCVTDMFPHRHNTPRGIDIRATMALRSKIKQVRKASLAAQVADYCAKHPDVNESAVADYLGVLIEEGITSTMSTWADALDDKREEDDIKECVSHALGHAAALAEIIDDTLPRFRAQLDAMRALDKLVAESTCEDAKKLYALMIEFKALDVFCKASNEREFYVVPSLPFPLV